MTRKRNELAGIVHRCIYAHKAFTLSIVDTGQLVLTWRHTPEHKDGICLTTKETLDMLRALVHAYIEYARSKLYG